MGFIDSEKVYNRANRKALYDVGVRLLSGITNMFVDSPACVKVEGGESERFKIDSGVRHGCILSLWVFNVYMDGMMKVKIGERVEIT